MKQCKKCHVKVRTDEDVCPLCQNKLVGSSMENVFPYVPTIKKRFSLFFKILLLVSIVISLICVAIDYALNKYHFSLLVVFGFVCLFIILKTTMTKRDSIYKTILWQLVIFAILIISWDYFTGWHSWSLTYAVPILCIVGSVSIAILSIVLHDYLDEELFYFICIALIGIIPLIFVFTNIITNKIPSVICAFLNIFCFIGLVIFKSREILEELKRRMHI